MRERSLRNRTWTGSFMVLNRLVRFYCRPRFRSLAEWQDTPSADSTTARFKSKRWFHWTGPIGLGDHVVAGGSRAGAGRSARSGPAPRGGSQVSTSTRTTLSNLASTRRPARGVKGIVGNERGGERRCHLGQGQRPYRQAFSPACSPKSEPAHLRRQPFSPDQGADHGDHQKEVAGDASEESDADRSHGDRLQPGFAQPGHDWKSEERVRSQERSKNECGNKAVSKKQSRRSSQAAKAEG